jgi:hypothetical protein
MVWAKIHSEFLTLRVLKEGASEMKNEKKHAKPNILFIMADQFRLDANKSITMLKRVCMKLCGGTF